MVFLQENADAPDGVSLEAVGAPGEQLADAVEAPAARGQMQRRAPGESAGTRALASMSQLLPSSKGAIFGTTGSEKGGL